MFFKIGGNNLECYSVWCVIRGVFDLTAFKLVLSAAFEVIGECVCKCACVCVYIIMDVYVMACVCIIVSVVVCVSMCLHEYMRVCVCVVNVCI